MTMKDEGKNAMKTKHILRVLLAGLIFLPIAANAQPKPRQGSSKPSAAKSSSKNSSSNANKAQKKRFQKPPKSILKKQSSFEGKRKASKYKMSWSDQSKMSGKNVRFKRPAARRVTFNDRAWKGQAGQWEPVNPPEGPGGPGNN